MRAKQYNRPARLDKNQRLSVQQRAVVDWAASATSRSSAFVEALAGTGKTSTLIAATRQMRDPVAFLAFNKKIADEIKHKTGDSVYRHVNVGTFHSFGYRAWRKAASAVQIEAEMKARQMIDKHQVPWHMRGAVKMLVSIAKQAVVGLLQDIDDDAWWMQAVDHYSVMDRVEDRYGQSAKQAREMLIDFSRKCLLWSREEGKKLIDFDDMLWLPLIEKVPVPSYPWVLVDEAQDTNAARRLLAERMSVGRSLFVGDRYQAIYGFTGADSSAVDRIIKHFNCQLLPLTVSFRCSKEATALAQKFVPSIVAHESNKEGAVALVSSNLLISNGSQSPRPGDAILCRNNRPLVQLAFCLIRQGVACHIEGRDIGRSLKALALKWRVASLQALSMRLNEYREHEIDRLMDKDEPSMGAVEAVNDKVDSLLAIMAGCTTIEDLQTKIDIMFKDTDSDGGRRTITLSTVHKAKGREWDRVWILGWGDYMPSRYARKEWERQAERNLQYVAVTRTKNELMLTPAIDGLDVRHEQEPACGEEMEMTEDI